MNKPWEESINVPFIVRWPSSIPEGKRLDTLFSTVDIAPTLLGLAGVPVPDRMQGADLSDILRGKPGAGPGPASVFIMGGAGVDLRVAGRVAVEDGVPGDGQQLSFPDDAGAERASLGDLQVLAGFPDGPPHES